MLLSTFSLEFLNSNLYNVCIGIQNVAFVAFVVAQQPGSQTHLVFWNFQKNRNIFTRSLSQTLCRRLFAVSFNFEKFQQVIPHFRKTITENTIYAYKTSKSTHPNTNSIVSHTLFASVSTPYLRTNTKVSGPAIWYPHGVV